MLLPSLLTWIGLALSGGASSGGLVHLEPRIGLRGSAGDFSFQAGLGGEIGIAALTFDPWIRPFRWDEVVQRTPTIRSKYHELRYGSTLGLRIRTPGDGAWAALSGGCEWVAGDWAGTVASPVTQVVPWVGLEGRSSGILGRLRVATESNRLGWIRLEIMAAFRFPKDEG